MPVQFEDASKAEEFLRQVAAQSYGSGLLEGTDGGRGSIGMIGDKPVKFNTHWYERVGKATSTMIESSNELRESLWNAAKELGKNGDSLIREWLKDVRKLLGIDPTSGSAGTNKTLLSRKVVAKVVQSIDMLRIENGRMDPTDKTQSSFYAMNERARSSHGVVRSLRKSKR